MAPSAKPKAVRRVPTRPARPRSHATPRAIAAAAPAAPDGAADTTRGKILATALRVFAERGFEGARTRDIAEQAGANLGLITYYFQNKETLWRAAVTSAFAELERELGAAMATHATGDARSQLEQLARHFVLFVARRPEFMRLMNDEGKQDSARMRWLVDRFVRPMHENLRALIEAGQARGFLPQVPVASLHYILLGAAGLIFSQAPECLRITGVDPTSEEFAAAHAAALVRIFAGR